MLAALLLLLQCVTSLCVAWQLPALPSPAVLLPLLPLRHVLECAQAWHWPSVPWAAALPHLPLLLLLLLLPSPLPCLWPFGIYYCPASPSQPALVLLMPPLLLLLMRQRQPLHFCNVRFVAPLESRGKSSVVTVIANSGASLV
ncbi:hypothetical protein JKP88DRAFT_263175 [Tribonema minus]|uniref:Secreted protein n=1 Tax=Tribonema minus TaxID=303371 RepID=A0A835YWA0_9STRA|nr:hypothetical protein JKP88DRAFT_263175 [Tribonema minus]